MRKKIILYTMTLTKGGAEQTIVNLANHFIQEYDVLIVTNILCQSEYVLDERIRHICLDTKNRQEEHILKKVTTKLSRYRTKRFKEIIKVESPSLVISFLPEPTIRLLSLKKEYPALPVVISIRNHPTREFRCFILRWIRDYYYRRADVIIVQDEAYYSYFRREIQDRMLAIPNFLSDAFVSYQQSGIEEKKIVTVTRLEKQKNLPLLIHAFVHLSSKFSDYKLYIYGIGRERAHLQRLIHQYHMEGRIILAGRVKEIIPNIESASLFVLSSDYEGMPNALLEAMALSLPVVTTNSTEVISSIITSGQNGIIVPIQDQPRLTGAMEEVLENHFLREKMRKEASKVREKYNKEKIINLWDDMVKKYM